jgi:hypothetical protein
MKDQQQEFRELASWVIDQTLKAGARECKVNISVGCIAPLLGIYPQLFSKIYFIENFPLT